MGLLEYQMVMVSSILSDERGFEAFRYVAFTPCLRLTGDMHWVVPAGANRDDVVVAGTRLLLIF